MDSVDDGYSQASGKTEGSRLLQEMSRLRAMMRPSDTWPDSVTGFAQAWNRWKSDMNGMDFSDLIEVCLREEVNLGFDAAIGMFDEAQDLSKCEFSLARFWGRNMDKVLFCGDGDQVLYSFRGASSNLGLNPNIPTHVLKNSYRVSKAVHAFSEQVINLIPPDERLQREYFPTDEPGEVMPLNGNYKSPVKWFDTVQKHLDNYETVMVLASCSYMLKPIVQFLKQEAIPFANSYRRKRRDWNPLVHGKKTITAATRVRDYLAGWRRDPLAWTGGEIAIWLPLAAGVLKRGGKDKLSVVLGEDMVPQDLLQEVLPVPEMLSRGPEWLLDHLSAAHRHAEYQIRVGLKEWADLETEPALTVGTIHSVKGGECDAVIIFPDLSPEAAKAVRHGEIGPTARMFFVGATRARTSLYLGNAVNRDFSLRFPG